jgi:hypothetical protein
MLDNCSKDRYHAYSNKFFHAVDDRVIILSQSDEDIGKDFVSAEGLYSVLKGFHNEFE